MSYKTNYFAQEMKIKIPFLYVFNTLKSFLQLGRTLFEGAIWNVVDQNVHRFWYFKSDIRLLWNKIWLLFLFLQSFASDQVYCTKPTTSLYVNLFCIRATLCKNSKKHMRSLSGALLMQKRHHKPFFAYIFSDIREFTIILVRVYTLYVIW